MAEYGMSDTEYKIIKEQVNRRLKMREEFLKKRTDPYRHAEGKGGYVFDEAHQRYISMKVTQLYFFYANPRTIMFGLLYYSIFPIFGTIVYLQRASLEEKYRTGVIKYRDRLFKLC